MQAQAGGHHLPERPGHLAGQGAAHGGPGAASGSDHGHLRFTGCADCTGKIILKAPRVTLCKPRSIIPFDATSPKRAAHLAKADLATATVTEMTDLAGTMGRHYAQKQGLDAGVAEAILEAASGLDAGVAEAIFEAALPRQAGDMLPTFHAGLIVSLFGL
eukprot:1161244-Pelagomonas_calceolata.AAC.16